MPERGFTLLEILLAVAALAILAGIAIFAINPPRQLAQARDAQRVADVNAILNAVYQYAADHNGQFPPSITTTPTQICRTDMDCTGLIDLSVLTNNGRYLSIMPADPLPSQFPDSRTGYVIYRPTNGPLTVYAPITETANAVIAASR